mmetsp:Transcript_21005/g.59946  ORF Transcript_21005/g.59946 Transcript_21005/m.59946 type:complete len:244 (-) Transcript_21005:964-1695(-)
MVWNLVSVGLSTTFETYALRIFRHLPPSPPARYELTLEMYSSILVALTELFCFLLLEASASSLLASSSASTSYWIASGLYPSTPNLDDSFPLLAARSRLSFSSSARIRARSFLKASFSRLRAKASRLRCSFSICSRVLDISLPMNRRCFSRSTLSTFSASSRSDRLAARSFLSSSTLASFSSGVNGLMRSVDSSKSVWPVLLACNSRLATLDKIFPQSLHLYDWAFFPAASASGMGSSMSRSS